MKFGVRSAELNLLNLKDEIPESAIPDCQQTGAFRNGVRESLFF